MSLQTIGLKHNTDKATFHKYLDFYEKYLPRRLFNGRLLEIGVMDGASMRMWREYYPDADIVGVDNALQSDLRIDGVTLLELDGTKPEDMSPLGNFHIIIDDGSHMTKDQQASFEWLYYNQLNVGGFYIIEDLHTSFNPKYVNSRLNTIEYLELLKERLDGTTQQFKRNKKSMTCIIRAYK